MKKIICRITPELIKKGKRNYCGYCPAALAIKHAFADSLLGLTEVAVNKDDITLSFVRPDFNSKIGDDDEFNKVIPLSKNLKKFIDDFDAKKKVKPMNFVLKLDLSN